MNGRRIAVVTILVMAASVLALSAVLSSGGTGGWALPAFLSAIVVVLVLGLVFLWRARGQDSRSDRRR